MTQPIKGAARVRVEADISPLVDGVAAGVRQVVAAAQKDLTAGFTAAFQDVGKTIADTLAAAVAAASEAAAGTLAETAAVVGQEAGQVAAQAVEAATVGAAGAVAGAADTIAETVADAGVDAGHVVARAVDTVGEEAAAGLARVGGEIASAVADVGDLAAAAVADAAEKIDQAGGDAGDAAADEAAGRIRRMLDSIRGVYDRATTAIGNANRRLVQTSVGQAVAGVVDYATLVSRASLGALGRQIGDAVRDHVDPAITAAFGATGRQVRDAVRNMVNIGDIRSTMSELRSQISAGLSTLFDTTVLRASLGAVRGQIADTMRSIGSYIKQVTDPTVFLASIGAVRGQISDALQKLADTRVGRPVANMWRQVTELPRAALGELRKNVDEAARALGQTVVTGTQLAGVALAGVAATALSAGLAFNSLSQDVHQALASVLGGRDAVRELVGEVIELNQTSPMSRQAFLASTQQLIGFGVAAEQVTATLDAMQQAAIAVGGGEEAFMRLTDILARVESQGKITGAELSRLGAMGINLVAIISEVTGESVDAVRRGLRSGQIGLEEISDALRTRYAGAVEGYANTWRGAQARLRATFRNVGSAMLEAFVGLERGGAAVEGLNAIVDSLRYIANRLLPVMLPRTERLADSLVRATSQIKEFVTAIPDSAFEGLEATLERIGPLVTAIGAGLATSLGGSLPILGSFLGGFNPIVVAIGVLVATTPELRDTLVDLLTALAPLLPAVADLATVLASGLGFAIQNIVVVLQPAINLLGVLVSAFTALPDGVQTATLAISGFLLALRFAGPVGAAITTLALLGAAIEAIVGPTRGARTDVTGLAEDIERLIRTGHPTADLRRIFAGGAEGVEEFADKLAVATAGFWDWHDHLNRTLNEISEAKTAFEDLDAAMAHLVKGGADADEVFQALVETYDLNEQQVQQLLSLLPQYTSAAERQAATAEEQADSQRELATATESVTAAMKEQADFIRAQIDPMFALNKAISDAKDAQTAYNDAVKDHGKNSQEAYDAAFNLAVTAADLQSAVAEAAGTFNGELDPALQAALGLMGATEGQLEGVKGAFEAAAAAADTYSAEYVARAALEGDKEAMDQWLALIAAEDEYEGIRLAKALLEGDQSVMKRLDEVKAKMDNIPRQISTRINIWADVTSSIRSAAYRIASAFGGVGGRALGGVITQPELSWLAEDGRPEVVIPLTRPKRALELTIRSGLLDVLGTHADDRTVGQMVTTLVGADHRIGADLAQTIISTTGTGAGDHTVTVEVRALRAEIRELRDELRRIARQPRVSQTINQAPGEDPEALARRIERRLVGIGG